MPSESVLWNVVLLTPSGLPQEYKVRAPSEAVLLDMIAQHKGPNWTVATDANGVPLIRREATA